MKKIGALAATALALCGIHAALPRAPQHALRTPPSATARAQEKQGQTGFTQAELEALTEEIKEQVEELRGLQFERPVRVAVTDRAGFLAYAKKRIELTSTPEEIAAQELVAKLTGVLPPGYDFLAETMKVLEEQVGGFYDPSGDAFYLMDSFGGDLARIILAHELTHALDDQHFDIDGGIEERKGDSDALFAFHAVVEGSGTAVMNRWMMERLSDLDPQALSDAGGLSMEAVGKAPPFVWKPLVATYLCGAAFLQRTDNMMKGQMGEPDPDDFDRAFEQPPRSSEQILHPAKYWQKDAGDEPTVVRIDTHGLPEGWQALHEDTLGELGWALVTEPLEERQGLDPAAVVSTRYTNDAASGWDGDRCVLLARGEARVLVSLSVWDDGREASEFRDQLASFAGHLRSGAEALAKLRGVEGAACVLGVGQPENSVLLCVAAGADEATVEELVAALSFGTGE